MYISLPHIGSTKNKSTSFATHNPKMSCSFAWLGLVKKEGITLKYQGAGIKCHVAGIRPLNLTRTTKFKTWEEACVKNTEDGSID